MTDRQRVLILGGGSGGLELACGLASGGRLDVTLVDRVGAHVWKPRLHEFAAGTVDTSLSEISFYTLAALRGFRFEQGDVARIDRAGRRVVLRAFSDVKHEAVAPERALPFERCVVALGGVTADFGTPGVKEHAYSLDGRADADAFRQSFVAMMLKARATGEPARIVIVGSGATGTELAANLREAEHAFFERKGHDDRDRLLRITILEAAPEIMPGGDAKLRTQVLQRLDALGIDVVTNAKVSAVEAGLVRTASGATYPADAVMWAAGLTGAPVLKDLADFEMDRKGRIVVDDRLRTTVDPLVYAIGDAASLTPADAKAPLPPTAQIASQEARYLAKALSEAVHGGEPAAFAYRNKGQLISLAGAGTVGILGSRDFIVNGRFAKAAYSALEREHQWTVLGPVRGTVAILADLAMPTRGPALKLHG
ncbi:NAD(P)/FAD-dependent oxidoreductase [Aureimonas leprariae]|uniref:FAD-dependent oxidoreductase n=1 Tax=Plantimonas leprariae TaxID=2615207 RepID=A0A7V7PL06_9HYPH|nr:FAD-dependent oxidoreductase [Aureimonas leprariae]KAB0676804.1 FAD-dependent oxidoreductase [Aureimonas leprariae]